MLSKLMSFFRKKEAKHHFALVVDPDERLRTIRFQHTDGKWYEERFNGIRAQVIQHEMDHLDGILICDKK